MKTENLQWLSTFSNVKYLDLPRAAVLDGKEWVNPINMLSSLETLKLRGCSLEDASSSLRVNSTSLRFLDLSQNFINSSIPPWPSKLQQTRTSSIPPWPSKLQQTRTS
ncbi:Pectinesterase [Psidium guajava]|nr:Pectinesterase [Psidium guajava]